MFKAGEEDPNLFYERFNRKRLRRIVFALVGAVFIGILHWFDVGIIYQISAITLVILIYSSVIVWDMFHARR